MALEWVLGIIAGACGGLNIFQFIFWRLKKQTMVAEANSASTDAEQKKIDLQQDQYDYLLSKLTQYQEEYFQLGERMKEESKKHADDISASNQRFMTVVGEKCNEIAELKSKLIYFKGLRCYRSDCSQRIKCNIKDKETPNGNS